MNLATVLGVELNTYDCKLVQLKRDLKKILGKSSHFLQLV